MADQEDQVELVYAISALGPILVFILLSYIYERISGPRTRVGAGGNARGVGRNSAHDTSELRVIPMDNIILATFPPPPPSPPPEPLPYLPPPAAPYRILNEIEICRLELCAYSPATIINDMCSICLEDFQEGEPVRCLPCSHAYHDYCITPWLYFRSSRCPLCKHDARNPLPLSKHGCAQVPQDWPEYVPLIRYFRFWFGTLSSNPDTIEQSSIHSELQPSSLEQVSNQVPGAFD